MRIGSPWVENMKAIGIDASIRQVDSAQYEARQADFDFDLVMMALSFSATPTRDDIEGAVPFQRRRPPRFEKLAGHGGPGRRCTGRRGRSRQRTAKA